MLGEAYSGLSDDEMTKPGVTDDWSVKDVLAHVTIWEEEALKYLPVIIDGKRTPRYTAKYGGIDAFNALMLSKSRTLSLSQVLEQLNETHRRLVDYLKSVPEEQFVRETRFRRRLKLETYDHYAIHAKMIQEWRAASRDTDC